MVTRFSASPATCCAGEITHNRLTTPDPFIPIAVLGGSIRPPQIQKAQRARRALILARARQSLAQDGYDGLSIQDLANQLNISKQTIYNLVGNKQQVVATSIVDHLASMVDIATSMGNRRNIILTMVDLYCDNFRSYDSYTKQAVLAMFQRDRILCAKVRASQHAWFLGWMRQYRAAGLVRDGTDLSSVTKQIVLLNEGHMLDWANGLCGRDELLQSFAASHGLMLLGITTHSEWPAISTWMANDRSA